MEFKYHKDEILMFIWKYYIKSLKPNVKKSNFKDTHQVIIAIHPSLHHYTIFDDIKNQPLILNIARGKAQDESLIKNRFCIRKCFLSTLIQYQYMHNCENNLIVTSYRYNIYD